jgi:hypothetical protein
MGRSALRTRGGEARHVSASALDNDADGFDNPVDAGYHTRCSLGSAWGERQWLTSPLTPCPLPGLARCQGVLSPRGREALRTQPVPCVPHCLARFLLPQVPEPRRRRARPAGTAQAPEHSERPAQEDRSRKERGCAVIASQREGIHEPDCSQGCVDVTRLDRRQAAAFRGAHLGFVFQSFNY